MIVGYMRKKEKPGHMAKLTSIMCDYYGLQLIYFRPEDVNQANDKVEGKILLKDKWVNVETDIPEFIDIHPLLLTLKRYKNVMKYLKIKTILSAKKRNPLPKDKIHSTFVDDPEVSQVLIPTKSIKKLEDITSFIDTYESIVIKPVHSKQGRSVYVINKRDNQYILGTQRNEKVINKSDLQEYFDNEFIKRKYIAQKYIDSRDSSNNPIDCRIHVEKNDKGEWINIKNYIRIGVGQKIVSNVSYGGGVSDLTPFLQANYGEKWKDVRQSIKNIATILPYKVEEIIGKGHMTFGFDIGIDKDGSLYLFEINGNPSVNPIMSQVAMSRAKYYKYVLINNNK